MRNCLYYDAVKLDGPKKKILEFVAEGKFLEEKELIHFEYLCNNLADKAKHVTSKMDMTQAGIMDRLLEFPVDKIFPCLDFYRIFLLHSDCGLHFKKFEEGMEHVFKLCNILQLGNCSDPNAMLSLRCLCNIFRDASG